MTEFPVLNFYSIVKQNLHFNRFEFNDTVGLEYTCPINAENAAIFSRNDYLVHVLSGKKTYKTINGTWTLTPGQTLYFKKGAEIVQQYFDDEYCMLAFFITDDLIRETFAGVRQQINTKPSKKSIEFTALQVRPSNFLDGYFQSMLNYFRGINRPPDHMLVLKLKELLITLINSDDTLAGYFNTVADAEKPSIALIMEQNFCYNLKLEDYAELSHRSLSSFKRDFQKHYNEPPGKWLLRRRVQHAAGLLSNSSKPVAEVAFESGFEDQSHFSKAFKSLMGTTPKAYKTA